MTLELRKITANRFLVFFLVFLMVLVSGAIGYVLYQKKVEADRAEEENQRVAAQARRIIAYENAYKKLLSGIQIDSLVPIVVEVLDAEKGLLAIGKQLEEIDCSHGTGSKYVNCSLVVKSEDGSFSAPELEINEQLLKPVIGKDALGYKGLKFKHSSNPNYDRFTHFTPISPPNCDAMITVFSIAKEVFASAGSKLETKTPLKEKLFNETHPDLNSGFYFATWKFDGNIKDLDKFYFLNESVVLKKFKIFPQNDKVLLEGSYSCVNQ